MRALAQCSLSSLLAWPGNPTPVTSVVLRAPACGSTSLANGTLPGHGPSAAVDFAEKDELILLPHQLDGQRICLGFGQSAVDNGHFETTAQHAAGRKDLGTVPGEGRAETRVVPYP